MNLTLQSYSLGWAHFYDLTNSISPFETFLSTFHFLMFWSHLSEINQQTTLCQLASLSCEKEKCCDSDAVPNIKTRSSVFLSRLNLCVMFPGSSTTTFWTYLHCGVWLKPGWAPFLTVTKGEIKHGKMSRWSALGQEEHLFSHFCASQKVCNHSGI